MTTIKLRGELYTLRSPQNDDECHTLKWMAAHYPVERVRLEATLLLAGVRCTAKPRSKQCQRSAMCRCKVCNRAICGRHRVRVRSRTGGSYYVCLVCRWQVVPHLERQ